MPSSLPITFSAMDNAFPSNVDAKKLLAELEAWLNFETMKKSWYENEEKVVELTCYLLTPEKFKSIKSGAENAPFSKSIIQQSDDNLIYAYPRPLKIIALFHLSEQPDYRKHLQTALIDITNNIANHLSLTPIDSI